MVRAILDTSVLIAGFRTRRGASFELFRLLVTGNWQPVLSNHLLTEYEEQLQLHADACLLSAVEIDDLLSTLAEAAVAVNLPSPQWPRLADPDDEPLLRLAEASGTALIVTLNLRHLKPAKQFGVAVLSPAEFLRILKASL